MNFIKLLYLVTCQIIYNNCKLTQLARPFINSFIQTFTEFVLWASNKLVCHSNLNDFMKAKGGNFQAEESHECEMQWKSKKRTLN